MHPSRARPQQRPLKLLEYYNIRLHECDACKHSPSNDLIESSPDALLVEEWRWNRGRLELDVSQRSGLNRLLSRSVKTTCGSPRSHAQLVQAGTVHSDLSTSFC